MCRLPSTQIFGGTLPGSDRDLCVYGNGNFLEGACWVAWCVSEFWVSLFVLSVGLTVLSHSWWMLFRLETCGTDLQRVLLLGLRPLWLHFTEHTVDLHIVLCILFKNTQVVFYFKIVKQLSYLFCKKKNCIITKNITHNLCLIFPKYSILCIYLSLFYRYLRCIFIFYLSFKAKRSLWFFLKQQASGFPGILLILFKCLLSIFLLNLLLLLLPASPVCWCLWRKCRCGHI